MKYFGTSKHHSTISQWEELNATTLTGAKREASKRFGGGLHGSKINVVEADSNYGQLNDIAPHVKTIPSGKWQYCG